MSAEKVRPNSLCAQNAARKRNLGCSKLQHEPDGENKDACFKHSTRANAPSRSSSSSSSRRKIREGEREREGGVNAIEIRVGKIK
jgi:hypothetical protein